MQLMEELTIPNRRIVNRKVWEGETKDELMYQVTGEVEAGPWPACLVGCRVKGDVAMARIVAQDSDGEIPCFSLASPFHSLAGGTQVRSLAVSSNKRAGKKVSRGLWPEIEGRAEQEPIRNKSPYKPSRTSVLLLQGKPSLFIFYFIYSSYSVPTNFTSI